MTPPDRDPGKIAGGKRDTLLDAEMDTLPGKLLPLHRQRRQAALILPSNTALLLIAYALLPTAHVWVLLYFRLTVYWDIWKITGMASCGPRE